MRKHNSNRLVALAVSAVFLVTSLVPPNAYTLVQTDEKAVKSIREAVPKSAGYVTEYDIAPGNNILVYIQDMHCNPSVQKNISKIISSLEHSIGVDKVILEGVPEGKVENNVFLALPEDIKYPVVEKLLNKGLLTGVELYSVENNRDNIYGVEKWDKYLENLYRAADLLQRQEYVLGEIRAFEKAVYSKSEKALGRMSRVILAERDKNWYKALNQKEFSVYPTYKYSSLSDYITSLNLSKNINVKKVQKELERYSQELKNTLSYKDYQNIVASADDQEKYFDALYHAAQSSDLPSFIEKYPELYDFLSFSARKSRINPMLVYHDEESYLDEVIRSESKEYHKHESYTVLKMTALLKAYFSLNMTEKEFGYFSQNSAFYAKLIEKHYPEFADTMLPLLEDSRYFSYYALNLERNVYFYDNLKKLVSAPKKGSVSVFVSGGFHTSLTEELKKSNISYVLVTPEISQNFNNRSGI